MNPPTSVMSASQQILTSCPTHSSTAPHESHSHHSHLPSSASRVRVGRTSVNHLSPSSSSSSSSSPTSSRNPLRLITKRLPKTPSFRSFSAATSSRASSIPSPASPGVTLSHNITNLAEEPLFMSPYLAYSPILPTFSSTMLDDSKPCVAETFKEPAIVFGEVDWSAPQDIPAAEDDEYNFVEQFAEARAVRMVAARPTLVELLKREQSAVARTQRFSLKRPVTPERSAKRLPMRATSQDTLDSDMSVERKRDALCRTPALTHDDDECASPTSEISEHGPRTPSVHSLDKENEDEHEHEHEHEHEDVSEPHSAMSDGKIDDLTIALSSTNPDTFKARMRMSRLRMFSRRSTATLSPTPAEVAVPASAPASPVESTSRLSLSTNLSVIRSKLGARAALEGDATSELAAELSAFNNVPKTTPLPRRDTAGTTLSSTSSVKPTGKRQRIRRMESRFGLNSDRRG